MAEYRDETKCQAKPTITNTNQTKMKETLDNKDAYQESESSSKV